MSSVIPGFINQGISEQYQYLKKLKAAQESGEYFNFKTGEIGQPPPTPQTGVPFDPSFLQQFISQFFPNFNGYGGYQPYGYPPYGGFGGFPPPGGGYGPPVYFNPYFMPPIFNPFFYHFFSPHIFMQPGFPPPYYGGFEDYGNFNDDIGSSNRFRVGQVRDPAMRGNDALDLLIEAQKVDSSELDANEDGDRYHFSDEDIEQFQSGLQNGDFTQKQLGLALMSKMGRINSNALDEYQGLITKLVDKGILDPRALMNPYFRNMKPERQELVLQGLADAGLKTNSRSWLNYIANNINNDEKPDLQGLLRNLISKYYGRIQENTDGADNQPIILLLKRLGFQLDDDGNLIADSDQPFTLETTV